MRANRSQELPFISNGYNKQFNQLKTKRTRTFSTASPNLKSHLFKRYAVARLKILSSQLTKRLVAYEIMSICAYIS